MNTTWQDKDSELQALMAQQRRREVTEDDGHDRLAMQEQVRAKDKRINQLEEAKYRLEEENAAMAKKQTPDFEGK